MNTENKETNSAKLPVSRSGVVTPYSAAWSAFKKTKEYRRCIKVLADYSITNPYADNILRVAFDAAWNSK